MKTRTLSRWRALAGILMLAGPVFVAQAEQHQQLKYRVISLPQKEIIIGGEKYLRDYIPYDMNEAGTQLLLAEPYVKHNTIRYRPVIAELDENGGLVVFATVNPWDEAPPEVTDVTDVFFAAADYEGDHWPEVYPSIPVMSDAGNVVAFPNPVTWIEFEGNNFVVADVALFSYSPFTSTSAYRNGWGEFCLDPLYWPFCFCYGLDQMTIRDINSSGIAVGKTYVQPPDYGGERWWTAAFWVGESPTALPGDTPSHAEAINELNRIVGCVSDNAVGIKACIWNGASVKSIGPDVFPSLAMAISPIEPTCVPPGPDGDLFNSNVAIVAWVGGGYIETYLYNGNHTVPYAGGGFAVDMTDTGIVLFHLDMLWAYTADRWVDLSNIGAPPDDPHYVKYVQFNGQPDDNHGYRIEDTYAISQNADILAWFTRIDLATYQEENYYGILRPMSTNPAPFHMNPGNPSSVLGITGWRSVRTHTGLGDLSIDFSPGTGVKSETRDGGIKKIAIDFDRAAYLVPGGCPPTIQNLTTLEYVPIDAVYFNADKTTLFIDVSTQSLPDQTCFRISIDGAVKSIWSGCDPNVVQSDIRALVGDVNNDEKTNAIDMAYTKSKNGQPVLPGNIPFDVNVDGAVNLIDMALVKSKNGNSARCP